MDLVEECRDDVSEELCALRLACAFVELDVSELGDTVDGEEQDELAVGMAQLAAVDVDVADDVALEAFAAVSGIVFGQPGDAMALEASVQGAAAKVRDGVAERAEHLVEQQEGCAPELDDDDDGLLGRGEHGALGPGSHRGVGGGSALAPFQDGFGVDAVLGGQGTGRRLRRLELGSNSWRCSGAALKNACHSASSA